ncbi:MAG: hypothetical protein JW784_02535, partial [Candidatus Cloacimonetes bacterium]|nr:hypothetical protein [Candidatus Cloacimonadota bacterium]
DEVDYYRLEDRITLQGNVLVREDHADSTYRTFSASRVNYRRGERQFEAYDRVTVYDQRENMSGECGEMHYFHGQGYGYLIKSPVLRVLSRDSLTVEAEKIEYFQEFQKVTANFNVRTISRDFLVESDFLLYFHQEGQGIYLGEPVFTSEFADARAQEIRVFFQDEKLHRAELQDSCRLDFAGEDELEKTNWVTSDYMEFTFAAGAVSACLAEGYVLSYFRQEESNRRDLAINDVQSRRLVVDLEKGRINSVIMQNSVKGRYKFRQD